MPPCGGCTCGAAFRLMPYFGCTRPTLGVRCVKIFEGVKRGLFIKSPLLRVSFMAFLFDNFFFAPTPAKKKWAWNLMMERKE